MVCLVGMKLLLPNLNRGNVGKLNYRPLTLWQSLEMFTYLKNSDVQIRFIWYLSISPLFFIYSYFAFETKYHWNYFWLKSYLLQFDGTI